MWGFKPILTKVAIVSVLVAMIATTAVIATMSSDASDEGILLSPFENDVKKFSVDPASFLRQFDYGRVSVDPDGTTVKEFTLITQDLQIEVAPGVYWDAWSFNGTVPGPTLRVTEGDRVRVTLINQADRDNTIHFHSIHPSDADGVLYQVEPNGNFVYEFTAGPLGLFLYHSHAEPVSERFNRGMYGVLIIDPETPRPPADEMVMVMNGYDTDFDEENNFYTVNGVAYYYMKNHITVKTGQLIRVYLVNVLEFDQINTFHLHGNVFKNYPTGTSLTDYEITDVVRLSQAERSIVEFTYNYPGPYMFQAHQTEFVDKGWTGMFHVVESDSHVPNGEEIMRHG
ncbi:MAG: multicopper oxidase domain-containing protein [Nitrososphaerales archaeon]